MAGLWLSEESVGDAGASSLGYFGGCWGPRGDYLLAHGFTGALHLWQRSGAPLCPQAALVQHVSNVAQCGERQVAIDPCICGSAQVQSVVY